ncbi:AAA family ATPase [Luteimonas sp. A501]
MKAWGTGLVVGKFAPLHRGHQLLLDQAAAACERLVILSYTRPEFPGCGPARRERWLRQLYPQASVLVLDDARLARWCADRGAARLALPDNAAGDETHRRFVASVLREMLGLRVDAVFTSEAYGPGFARALGGLQGAPVAHVEVDRARVRVPVSGTRVRADVHAHRHLLDPRVHADFVERIVLLGGESTGKTTLARALAARLGTTWVPEYGRELWEARGGRLEYADMLLIARAQVEREDAAAAGVARYLVCDTSPLTTLLYSQAMFGRADPELARLAGRPYAQVLLCEPDFGFVQDGTRRDPEFQAGQQAWYGRELASRGIAFERLRGSPGDRLRQVEEVLATGGLRTSAMGGQLPVQL